MIRVSFDGRMTEVAQGATLLEAARTAGIAIPTMCHSDGADCASTSCLVCLVRDRAGGRLLPACTAIARDGQEVDVETPEVQEARRQAVELLLSEHLGDCEGPCRLACPARLDVPALLRAVHDGQPRQAAALVHSGLAVPAVLSRLCHAPCEKVCRRRAQDEAVSIRMVERFATDLEETSIEAPAASGFAVAVVGSGPAGLAAAHGLRLLGHACTVFDANPECGGSLRVAIAEGSLDAAALDGDLRRLERLGVRFRPDCRVERLEELRSEYAAVVLAPGHAEKATRLFPQVMASHHHAHATGMAGRTVLDGVVACGNALHPCRTVVHAVGDGGAAARLIDTFLRGEPVAVRPFTCHFGPLQEGELVEFMKEASPAGRVVPASVDATYSVDEARREGGRCLHCDCRKRDDCRLRECATATGAVQRRYRPVQRKRFRKNTTHGRIVYEPGKCIKCGLCVQVAARAGEADGVAFLGRGWEMEMGAAFGESLAQALEHADGDCADVCPTGALARGTAEKERSEE